MEMGTEFTFESTNLPQCCFKLFSEMRNQDKFCDIKFTVGERQLTAHRVILAAVMPFFGEMSSEEEIQIPDIDPTVLECLMDYAYSCKLKITMDNVRGLLSASCILRIEEVQNACCDFVSQRLQLQNVWSFRDLANDLNLQQLKEFIDFYVKENFEEVSKTEEFLDTPFTYVKELIARDDLNVDSEEKVLESVLRWVKASPSKRKDNLPELLRQVRMVLIKPLYLMDMVERDELIRTSVAARDLVDEAKNYNLFPERRKAMCSFSAATRQLMRGENVKEKKNRTIYSLNAEVHYTVLQFDLTRRRWCQKAAKEYCINYGGFAVLDKKMYFFSDYIFEYDSTNDKCRLIEPFRVPKKFMAAVSLRNKIFFCGGRLADLEASNSVECFDVGKDEWTQVDSMQTARWGLNAVSLADYIYALGGRDKRKIYDTVERYSFVTGRWQCLSSMLIPRNAFGCSVLNGKIYACGGYATVDGTAVLQTAEVYDPITSKWNLISPMKTARCCFNLFAFCGQLYVTFGTDPREEDVFSYEIYDPPRDKWICSTWSNSFLHSAGLAVM